MQEPKAPEQPLSDKCASLVMLGDPHAWDTFQEELSAGRLATSLQKIEAALRLPVRIA